MKKTILALTAVLVAVALGGCGTAPGALADDLAPVGDQASFAYTGGVQTYTVPAGVTSLTITAIGGAGGVPWGVWTNRSGAATVTGTLAVTPGQQLLISVGGQGGDAGDDHVDAPGGWGGLGGSGGPGKSEKDTLRSSGGGGGASTVQLAAGGSTSTIMVAAGGGGTGGGSGDPMSEGTGGNGGCTGTGSPYTPSWTGGDGQKSRSDFFPGAGGAAAAQAGAAGAQGHGGSGEAGDGGGGGGGVKGGDGGGGAEGTSAGGGGGAGSSTAAASLTGTAVTCRVGANGAMEGGNGLVTVTPLA
jgi:hypothetical protein